MKEWRIFFPCNEITFKTVFEDGFPENKYVEKRTDTYILLKEAHHMGLKYRSNNNLELKTKDLNFNENGVEKWSKTYIDGPSLPCKPIDLANYVKHKTLQEELSKINENDGPWLSQVTKARAIINGAENAVLKIEFVNSKSGPFYYKSICLEHNIRERLPNLQKLYEKCVPMGYNQFLCGTVLKENFELIIQGYKIL